MGKKKGSTKITTIHDHKKRKTTYFKRSRGVMKKIHELGVLCDQDTFFFVRDRATGRVQMFSSSKEQFIPDYTAIKPEDRQGPDDMQRYYNKGKSQSPPGADTPSPPQLHDNLRSQQDILRALLQQGLSCHGLLQSVNSLQCTQSTAPGPTLLRSH
jgi:hypothetical protein